MLFQIRMCGTSFIRCQAFRQGFITQYLHGGKRLSSAGTQQGGQENGRQRNVIGNRGIAGREIGAEVGREARSEVRRETRPEI